MTGESADVIWSPKRDDDRFLVLVNGELTLYHLVKSESGGDYYWRKIWSPSSDLISNISCVSWCPVSDETVLAISTIQQSQPQSAKSLIYHVEKSRLRELFSQRACLYLEWNPERPNLLATGFTHSSNGRALAMYHVPLNSWTATSHPIKSASEHFYGESSIQGGWLSASQFVVGMHSRPRGCQLRIVDCDSLSQSVRFHVASARVAQGLCIEPIERKLVAVHGKVEDGAWSRNDASTDTEAAAAKYVIEIWFMSSPERAYCILPLDRPVKSMKWSPFRPLLLGVLLQSASDVLVFDFSRVTESSDDRRAPITFHCTQVCPIVEADSDIETGISATDLDAGMKHTADSGQLIAFSWTAVNRNLLVALGDNASLQLLAFHEKVSIGWRAPQRVGGVETLQLAFECDSFPEIALSRTVLVSESEISDAARRMCTRASRGYGLYDPIVYLRDSTPLGFDLDQNLRTGWDRIAILCSWRNRYYTATDRVDREVLFRVCTSVICFNDVDEDTQDNMLDAASSFDSWSKRVELERAAFIAAAQMKFDKARELLLLSNRLSDAEKKILGDALAGSSEQDPGFYDIATVGQHFSAITDPYVKGVIEIFSNRNEPERVLLMGDLPIIDRIAYCCLQVTDIARLTECVKVFVRHATERGDLNGLLLTGFTTGSLGIIQAYLDRSYDVQSATLFTLALFERSELVLRSRPFRVWFDAYRDFLNRTRLWKHRARFDVRFKSALSTAIATRPHLHICCASCGSRISQAQAAPTVSSATSAGASSNLLVSPTPNLAAHDASPSPTPSQSFVQTQTSVRGRKGSSPGANTTNATVQQNIARGATRANVCANASCKKPLPKCAICLLTLGLPLGEALFDNGRKDADFEVDSSGRLALIDRSFHEWFCVCLRCRHGGHSAHLQEWFRSHPYCPVADCTCRCKSLE